MCPCSWRVNILWYLKDLLLFFNLIPSWSLQFFDLFQLFLKAFELLWITVAIDTLRIFILSTLFVSSVFIEHGSESANPLLEHGWSIAVSTFLGNPPYAAIPTARTITTSGCVLCGLDCRTSLVNGVIAIASIDILNIVLQIVWIFISFVQSHMITFTHYFILMIGIILNKVLILFRFRRLCIFIIRRFLFKLLGVHFIWNLIFLKW